ncbi:rhodanese-like domain-containing protein [Gangjinia marincola]|uniref:Rhodanese-like domain-containing protein n=1 Tax=Gangjinia marincola TaxID=578463 RepID=A0ABP3XX51_9FLAO
MEELSSKDFQEKYAAEDEAVLLDVRTPEEVEEGYIPEAQNINILAAGSFMEEIQQLDKSKSYYVYCRSGGRSSQTCQIMDQMGFTKTYNLIGGITEWDGPVINS